MDIAHSSTAVTSSRISSFSCHLTKCPHSFTEHAGQFLLLCLECLPAGHLSCSVEGLCVWEWLRSAERLWQCTGEAGLLPLLIHCYSYKLQKLSLGTIITIQFQGISHTSLSPCGHFEVCPLLSFWVPGNWLSVFILRYYIWMGSHDMYSYICLFSVFTVCCANCFYVAVTYLPQAKYLPETI